MLVLFNYDDISHLLAILITIFIYNFMMENPLKLIVTNKIVF